MAHLVFMVGSELNAEQLKLLEPWRWEDDMSLERYQLNQWIKGLDQPVLSHQLYIYVQITLYIFSFHFVCSS